MENIETDGVNIIDEDRRCQVPRTMVFPTADNDEERSIKDRGVSKKIEKMAWVWLMKTAMSTAVGKRSSGKEEMLSAAWKEEEKRWFFTAQQQRTSWMRVNGMSGGKGDGCEELTGWAAAKVMVASVGQSVVPRYSAAGNGKEREVQERDGPQQRTGWTRVNGASASEDEGGGHRAKGCSPLLSSREREGERSTRKRWSAARNRLNES
jgi:hypothetical protein